jgi:hypothetical protein
MFGRNDFSEYADENVVSLQSYVQADTPKATYIAQ